jgi:hypothetical protein
LGCQGRWVDEADPGFEPAAMIETPTVGRPKQRPERPASELAPDISALGDAQYLPGGDRDSPFSTVTIATSAAADRG